MLTGKGIWIERIAECAGGIADADLDALAARLRAVGFDHVLVKVANGNDAFNLYPHSGLDLAAELIPRLRAAHIQVWGWQEIYGDTPRWQSERLNDYHRYEAEQGATRVTRLEALGLSGLALFTRGEYEQLTARARRANEFMRDLRAGLPGLPIGLSSWKSPLAHPRFPWQEFRRWIDVDLPQVFWVDARRSVGALVQNAAQQFAALDKQRSLPLVPVGAAFEQAHWRPTPDELTDFLQTTAATGLPAANLWLLDELRRPMFERHREAVRQWIWPGLERSAWPPAPADVPAPAEVVVAPADVPAPAEVVVAPADVPAPAEVEPKPLPPSRVPVRAPAPPPLSWTEMRQLGQDTRLPARPATTEPARLFFGPRPVSYQPSARPQRPAGPPPAVAEATRPRPVSHQAPVARLIAPRPPAGASTPAPMAAARPPTLRAIPSAPAPMAAARPPTLRAIPSAPAPMAAARPPTLRAIPSAPAPMAAAHPPTLRAIPSAPAPMAAAHPPTLRAIPSAPAPMAVAHPPTLRAIPSAPARRFVAITNLTPIQRISEPAVAVPDGLSSPPPTPVWNITATPDHLHEVGALFRAVRRGQLGYVAALYAPESVLLAGGQRVTLAAWSQMYARLNPRLLMVTGVENVGATLWVHWQARTWRGAVMMGSERLHLNRRGLVAYHDSQLLG